MLRRVPPSLPTPSPSPARSAAPSAHPPPAPAAAQDQDALACQHESRRLCHQDGRDCRVVVLRAGGQIVSCPHNHGAGNSGGTIALIAANATEEVNSFLATFCLR